MKTSAFRLGLLAFAVGMPSAVGAEGLKHGFCATYPGSDLVPIVRSREARARRGIQASASDRQAADVRRSGDVALLIDQGDLVLNANFLDLQGKGLEFRPGYTVSRVDRPLSPDGVAIALGDDDSRQVALPFSFPFFGKNYDQVFVNSDGNITFEAADSASTPRTLARLVSGPPRIAPLLSDLDPSKSGRITTTSRADAFIVKWTDVPQFDLFDKNTFEVTLFPDGRITFSYDPFNASANINEAAVGIAAGGGIEGLQTTDLSTVAGFDFPLSIGESFRAETDIDLGAVGRAFYSTFGDDYQQLIIYTNRRVIPPSESAFAYEITVRNSIEGTGTALSDGGAEFGSAAALESVVLMDAIDKYSDTLNQRVLREETSVSVLSHEVGHRWLATARFMDGGVSSTDLLGRQQAHWSFYMNSSGSHDEGNQIDDLGGGSFKTGATSQRYGPLDQYLMGLRAPEEVPDFFIIKNPIADGAQSAARPPESNVSIRGTRKDVTVGDVIAAMGPRSPAPSPNPPAWRVAFLYVTAGDEKDGSALGLIETLRSQFEASFPVSTDGRLSVETRLK